MVIDNNVAKDKMQKNVLKFAAPPEIKVSIFSVDKAVEIWEKNKFGNLSVFVLFKDVKQIKELADKPISSEETVQGLIDDVEYWIRDTKEIVELADAAGDGVTADQFNDYLGEYQKLLWMLKSYIA